MNDHKALYPVTDEKPKTPQNKDKADQRQVREARLHDALRANLHKRKRQGRERTAEDGPAPSDPLQTEDKG